MKSTCTPKTVIAKLYSEKNALSTDLIGQVEMPEFEGMPQVLVIGEDVFVGEKSYYRGDYKYVRMNLIHVIEPGQVQTVKFDGSLTKPAPAPAPVEAASPSVTTDLPL
jgi:hypothetical protein